MVAQPLEIHVDPESETGKLLAQAKVRPLRLVSGGESYRVEADVGEEEPSGVEAATEREDPFANYDPERAAAAWRAFAEANVFEGVDTEALKAELREMRGQDTPGRPAW